MQSIHELAPAKINLALHVTGLRQDGYHLLDSLVGFSRHGDMLHFRLADEDSFTLSGPFAALLDGEACSGNLVIKARDRLRALLLAGGHAAPAIAIELQKNLPVAAGIGGGSADAAAALRGLQRAWQVELPPERLASLAVDLGADVPMCLAGQPLRAKGIGEQLTPLPHMPLFGLLLGNPLQPVSTPAIFKALQSRDNAPLPPPPAHGGQHSWTAYLQTLRNDLEPPARTLCPAIAELAALIAGTGALVTRMSGSGASCFGLFATQEQAEAARVTLHAMKPDWYFSSSSIGHAGV
ncbi:4-(cytidine 5'-diphospho)-2-C-methyl-D-erythritol kinase [Allorhizobium undicola]|uniref:4-(cytidine 5'-diphospho)-2-C-methyl-D-erythritol kinase n=1 Tax=Allorhizobium undicola TaxID=78527 RepID=UPI0004893E5D|nr:4-(cytidine 5'-diphospho)-2-C-methyl-D-erythritol kinase [Allorhizobium undicola]